MTDGVGWLENSNNAIFKTATYNRDFLVLRGGISSNKIEGFFDYMFLGYSNLDAIGGITTNNDYSCRLSVNGNL